MDDRCFDSLTRAMAGGASRRGLLRLLAGGLAGGALPRLGPKEAAARDCAFVGERCSDRFRCCRGLCLNGFCVCRGVQKDCGDRVCHNLRTDPAHCGACGRACSPGLVCCDGDCFDATTDDRHCGACGRVCPEGTTCCAGDCRNLLTNREHCGKCGNVCGENEVCRDGVCLCRKGSARCDGVCRDVERDPHFCGSCQTRCPAGHVCCRGVCRDVQNDRENCGGCGRLCLNGESCCAGTCTTTRNDGRNCGACGRACRAADQTCRVGECVCQQLGLIECNGVCKAGEGGRCAAGSECCSGECYRSPRRAAGTCAPCRGRRCVRNADCCGGLTCRGGFCDGCLDANQTCEPDGRACCFSDCTVDGFESTCLSNRGGRCERDFDCRACFFDPSRCVGACTGGRCTV